MCIRDSLPPSLAPSRSRWHLAGVSEALGVEESAGLVRSNTPQLRPQPLHPLPQLLRLLLRLPSRLPSAPSVSGLGSRRERLAGSLPLQSPCLAFGLFQEQLELQDALARHRGCQGEGFQSVGFGGWGVEMVSGEGIEVLTVQRCRRKDDRGLLST
eukprot:262258-Rhodomonas_salina.1